MSLLSQFIMSGGGGKLRYQEFNSSGTFVPSAKLLANGGQCFVTLIGGGGGGGGGPNGCGGDAGRYVEGVVTVVLPTTVTIGAGGLGAVSSGPGATGGNSSFGALLFALGGRGGARADEFPEVHGGNGAGGNGSLSPIARGGVGINGKCGGGSGVGVAATTYAVDGGGNGAWTGNGGNAVANSGGGGGGSDSDSGLGGNGGSGWCRVVWFE